MNDYPELFPKPDPAFKERTIQDAVRLFRQQEYGTQRTSFWQSLAAQWKPFATGMAAASLLFLFLVHGPAPTIPAPTDMAADITLLGEMHKVFGNQLQGVVQDGGSIQPVVSTTNTYTDAQPVIITIRKGNQVIRIISYSGNTVTFPLDHKEVSVSPTVTGDGKVIIEGKDFLWSRGKATGEAPGIIDAKPLGRSL